MMLSTLLEDLLLANEGVSISRQGDVGISGITPDSREVRKDFLFAALSGSVVDGTKFIPNAIEAGASAILCDMSAEIADADDVTVIRSDDPRRVLALMAARFYGRGPENIVAVTGTNGKTSVASFTRQLWTALGLPGASLGTVGLETATGTQPVTHTTPEPVTLQKLLTSVADRDITHLALEASSHGLEQRRLDGLRIKTGAFTNISRDHLDYHKDFEDYFTQKLRLFNTLLPDDGVVVVNADSEESAYVVQVANMRGLEVLSVGEKGETLRLVSTRTQGFGQQLEIAHEGGTCEVALPLAGGFQASNALVAAGLVVTLGVAAEKVLPMLAKLKGARGRLEHVGSSAAGVPVFIDYAHTPDALQTALEALRPFARGRLGVIFGCGGDRDQGKRPQMGEIAMGAADVVIVTDDNPRSEDAAQIRADILKGAPGAMEIGDRRDAIRQGLGMLDEGDLLLVAGKGHETGQIVGDKVLPYSDHEAVEELLKERAS